MAKKTRKQVNDKRWIADENLQSQARQLKARIKETSKIAESNFWEYISGSFQGDRNSKSIAKSNIDFSRACYRAVIEWFIANSSSDRQLLDQLRVELEKSRGRDGITGLN